MHISAGIKRVLNRFRIVRYAYIFVVTARVDGIIRGYRMVLREVKKDRLDRVRQCDVEQLQAILDHNGKEPYIIYCPLLDWNVPLFQRPQHLAWELARHGFLYFYCTFNCLYDNVGGVEPLAGNLYLTNRFQLLKALPGFRIIHLNSTDNMTDYEFIVQEVARGSLVVYEYIDEIHDKVSGVKIPESTYRRHEMLLRDERCIVVATADKLYREVLEYRSKNCALVTNGVDFDHFAQVFSFDQAPAEIKPLIAEGKPIIGYFGALASWFDYELVCKLAVDRPEYSILLIGWNYDRSMDAHKLGRFDNLHVIGPIQYQDLPRYAWWFDVATIPFLINEITESTSPIKLFEYMALGKPIVTTNLPECRKYESVMIGATHEEFIDKIDVALNMRKDEGYLSLLRREALENTWTAKGAVIAKLIRENLPGD